MERMEQNGLDRCDIIRDLLPLYVDGVASEAARRLIEEHIKECEACEAELARLKEDMVLPVSHVETAKEAQFFYRIKKGFRKKKFRVALVSVFLTAAVIVGTYCLAVLYEWVIPYDEAQITTKIEGGKVYVRFGGDNYQGYYGYGDSTVYRINGEEKQIYVFCYTENLWSRFAEPLMGKSFQEEERWTKIYDAGDALQRYDRVYYGDAKELTRQRREDPDGPISEEVLEEMTVLWERPQQEENEKTEN